MKGATPILSISTSMSPERAGELCSNWWPVPSLANTKAIPGMPHPSCRVCANWLPDLEDIGTPMNIYRTKRLSNCGNNWPKERNLRSALLPATCSPVLREVPPTDQTFK